MNTPLEIVLLVSAVAIPVILLLMLREIKKSRAATVASSLVSVPMAMSEHSGFEQRQSMGSPAGFALFVFREGVWMLQEDYSKPGFVAVPPAMDGTFEGQVLRRESALPAAS